MKAHEKRIRREWRAMAEGKISLPPNCIVMVKEELTKLLFFFPGPEGSPYRNDIINLELEIPSTSYPFSAPTVLCRTEIFHPIKVEGNPHICMPYTCGGQWSPSLSMGTIICDFYELLKENKLEERIQDNLSCEGNYCFNNSFAMNLFRSNKPKYDETIQVYRSKYMILSYYDPIGTELIHALLKAIIDRDNFLLAFYKGELMSEKINQEEIRREVGKFLFPFVRQKEESSICTIIDLNSETRKISTLREDILFARELEGRNQEEILRKYLHFFSGV